MTTAMLEHLNVTVSDPARTAQKLCELFGWRIRWKGPAKYGGTTIHVGTDDGYLAVFSAGSQNDPERETYYTRGGLNHIGVVVDDLDEVESRVRNAGYRPHSHADYEPGRRFYFDDEDGIEFEVVAYEEVSA